LQKNAPAEEPEGIYDREGISLFERLSIDKKRKFIKYAFVCFPIGFILGLTAALFILHSMGLDFTYGEFTLLMIIVLAVAVGSVVKYYKKLISEKD